MNPYVNEDAMWQRLKDLQREGENRRLYGHSSLAGLGALLRMLGTRVWWLAGLAARRPPRRRSTQLVNPDRDRASDAA